MASVISMIGSDVQGKEGAKVQTSNLFKEGHVVGLYFSAHWCPPCRGFTPKLAEFYNKLKDSKQFEIVFVSSDRDQAAFDEYFKEMPWLALPFEAREKKNELSKKYKVNGIPTLVLLDGASGEVITQDGRGGVMEDPNGDDFPWKPKPFSEIFVGELLRKGDPNKGAEATDYTKTTVEEATKDKVTGIYFSAHWCPPCRTFTPQLVEVYDKLKKQGKNFEVIFASSDRSEDAFKDYYDTMPWLAIPFSDSKRKKQLSKHFEVEGIPTLIILDENKEVITSNGRGAVSQDKEGKKFPWIPEPLDVLNEMTATSVNETPTLLYLTGNGEEAQVNKAKELLQEVATIYKAEVKEAKKQSKEMKDLIFLYEAEESGDLAESVRGFANLDDRNPLVVILDIQGQSKYIVPEGELTKEQMQKLVDDFRTGALEFKPLR